jgi:hypothetical protein
MKTGNISYILQHMTGSWGKKTPDYRNFTIDFLLSVLIKVFSRREGGRGLKPAQSIQKYVKMI